MIYLISAALIFILTLTYCAGTFLANIVSQNRDRRAEKLKAEILNAIL